MAKQINKLFKTEVFGAVSMATRLRFPLHCPTFRFAFHLSPSKSRLPVPLTARGGRSSWEDGVGSHTRDGPAGPARPSALQVLSLPAGSTARGHWSIVATAQWQPQPLDRMVVWLGPDPHLCLGRPSLGLALPRTWFPGLRAPPGSGDGAHAGRAVQHLILQLQRAGPPGRL